MKLRNNVWFVCCVLSVLQLAWSQQEIWRDDFKPCKGKRCINGLQKSYWNIDIGDGSDNGVPGWGNEEKQCYMNTKDVVQVKAKIDEPEDGVLAITAFDNPSGFLCENAVEPSLTRYYKSGRINTNNKKIFRWTGDVYNHSEIRSNKSIKVEARIKLPKPSGDGLWTAFWMLPQAYTPDGKLAECNYKCDGRYGRWPFSGEMDIMEAVNNMNHTFHTIHYWAWFNFSEAISTHAKFECSEAGTPYPTGCASDYHVYGMEWSPDIIRFYIDEKNISVLLKEYWNGWWKDKPSTTVASPFDEPFYIILNMAVGGKLTRVNDKDVDISANFPATMYVDWVRVIADAPMTYDLVRLPKNEKPLADNPGFIAGMTVGCVLFACALLVGYAYYRDQQRKKKANGTQSTGNGFLGRRPTGKSGSQNITEFPIYASVGGMPGGMGATQYVKNVGPAAALPLGGLAPSPNRPPIPSREMLLHSASSNLGSDKLPPSQSISRHLSLPTPPSLAFFANSTIQLPNPGPSPPVELYTQTAQIHNIDNQVYSTYNGLPVRYVKTVGGASQTRN